MKKFAFVAVFAIVWTSVFAADLYDEPTRPQLRFSQRTGWINDPNGLSYRNGEWHFFFQHNPAKTSWGNLHWGHAVSKDLLHWEEVDAAIAPEGDVLMYSGSAVTDVENAAGFGKGAHLLFYTAAPRGKNPSGVFRQELAWSLDGRTYTKWRARPVVPNQTGGKDDRDPFVFWHAPTKTWVMVLYLQLNGHHAFRIFNSTDLRTWTPTQDLLGDPLNVKGWRYECPGLVKLMDETGRPSRWVLWGAGPLYDVGDFDGKRFTARAERLPGWVGGPGSGYYAGQVFNDAPDGRVIKVEWFRMNLGADGFNQGFSLPQELTLRTTSAGTRLVRRPIRELESLRDGPAVPLARFQGELAEADLACTPGADAVVTFDLRGVKLVYDAAAGTLACGARTAPWPLAKGRLELRAYLDRVGLEVFAKDGSAVFPVPEARPDRARTDLSATYTGTVTAPRFRAYRLRSIHAQAADHYVDDRAGDDARDGLTPATAWRTLARVDAAALRPGDRVLFRRGGLWRGGFRPKSGVPGAPVTYGAYGEGAKPILQQSCDRSDPACWRETAPGVWATASAAPQEGETELDLDPARETSWRCGFPAYMRGGMRYVTEDGRTFLRFTCAEAARDGGAVQLWGPETRDLSADVAVTFEMRASRPFRPPAFNFMTYSGAPWVANYTGTFDVPEISNAWTRVTAVLRRAYPLARPTYVHWVLSRALEPGMTLDVRPIAVRALEVPPHGIRSDVGIAIFDHGRAWGVKKWRPEDLKKDLDYWYDEANRRILLKSARNPGERYRSIELALTEHIVAESFRHDVTYENLAFRYTGAHAICGSDTRNIVIRGNDFGWIGGGLQYWKTPPKGKPYPVRYGNAVEFWGYAVHNLVERNRFWQIYDAAMTNQSNSDPRAIVDQIWRDNTVWQAEYSFEYWNHYAPGASVNIVFEHNTCIDAGACWSHGQRPNPNGAHLMFYPNTCATTNFIVRNNIFCRGVDRSTRMWNDWRAKNPAAKDGLVMENNLYWFPTGKVFEFNPTPEFRAKGEKPCAYGAGEEAFRRYQAETGLDQGSVWGEPQFMDAAAHDYRLKPGSFGSDLATDGGPLGARH